MEISQQLKDLIPLDNLANLIEIEWSKVKNPDSRDSLRHCDGYDDEYFRSYDWKSHILNGHIPENCKYYSVKGFFTARDIDGNSMCRYDIFFWKEKPELVEERER